MKIYWDIFIILLLIIVCTIIPWRLAFDKDTIGWEIAYYVIDLCFLIDMILTFYTTVPSQEHMQEIYDKKTIAQLYLKSWFMIDLLSIIPFDSLLKWMRGGDSD